MALFSTAYFPCIRYAAQALKADTFRIELYETYQKQTYRSRCVVMTANGVESLSVPVVKTHGSHTITKDIGVSDHLPWQQIHRRCLESAYRNAPFFDHYYPAIEPIFGTRFKWLVDLNEATMQVIFNMLKINKEILYSTDFEKNADNDFRNAFNAKKRQETTSLPVYYQVFETKFPFAPDLSMLDLIFNEGPESKSYLNSL